MLPAECRRPGAPRRRSRVTSRHDRSPPTLGAEVRRTHRRRRHDPARTGRTSRLAPSAHQRDRARGRGVRTAGRVGADRQRPRPAARGDAVPGPRSGTASMTSERARVPPPGSSPRPKWLPDSTIVATASPIAGSWSTRPPTGVSSGVSRKYSVRGSPGVPSRGPGPSRSAVPRRRNPGSAGSTLGQR